MAPVEKNINPSVGSQLKIGRWMLLVEGKEYRQIHGCVLHSFRFACKVDSEINFNHIYL
jgi:hypothetical protein